ncbi:hypothetical protein CSOJ01_14402 [Colletotrichum sojae]|uniref:Uncharacterized protein n=1 Tax=Colletotrichum sojae TaxID=2175907 RepID=A0A8H6MJD6_9PEZI|nr:hypothetical protein CSOJ01_14402 [Colletotrichum sojae]
MDHGSFLEERLEVGAKVERAVRIGARAVTRRHLRRSSVRECGGITRLEVPHHLLGPGEETGNTADGRSITKKTTPHQHHHTTLTKERNAGPALNSASAPGDGQLSGYRRSFHPTLNELPERVLASPQTIESFQPISPTTNTNPTGRTNRLHPFQTQARPPAKSSRAAPAVSGHSPGRFDRHATTTPSAEESLPSWAWLMPPGRQNRQSARANTLENASADCRCLPDSPHRCLVGPFVHLIWTPADPRESQLENIPRVLHNLAWAMGYPSERRNIVRRSVLFVASTPYSARLGCPDSTNLEATS